MKSECVFFIAVAIIIVAVIAGITFYQINFFNLESEIAKEALKSGCSQKVIFSSYSNPIVIWVQDANEIGYSERK